MVCWMHTAALQEAAIAQEIPRSVALRLGSSLRDAIAEGIGGTCDGEWLLDNTEDWFSAVKKPDGTVLGCVIIRKHQ